MAKEVNPASAKCFIIFMAAVILAQGVLYFGLAIKGIKMHNCAIENSDPIDKPVEFFFSLIYFSSDNCGAPNIQVSQEGHTLDLQIQIDFKRANALSDREYIFFISYAIISALWVATSGLILATIFFKINKVITLLCFWPWLVSVLLGSVLDAIATFYHIKDISNTTSLESFLIYVGVVNLEDVMKILGKVLENFAIITAVPAIIFACITSRIVLIWLLNICGVICCFNFARSLSGNNAENDKSKQPRRPSSADTAIPFDSNSRRGEPAVALRFQPSEETVRKALRSLEPVPNSPVHRKNKDSWEPVFVLPSASHQTASNKNSLVSKSPLPSPNPAEASTYQISDSHPQNLDYPINRLSTPSTSKTVRSVTPELSAISPLNIRYSTVDGAALFPNAPHVNQELRGQLPWSYMNVNDDPVAKQRIQAHRRADEEKNDGDEKDKDFPPIPVPDYTTHSPTTRERASFVNRTSQKDYSRW